MNYISDLHTHTIAGGHAYSTLIENAKEASKNGIKVLGFTEHGPNMPGGPHLFHFGNLKVIPRKLYGVTILKGCEANIIDYNGNLDIPKRTQENLELIVASLHDVCLEPGTIEQNTNALINVMENPNVDILGHIGNPIFKINAEQVVKKAKERNILIEINNSSFLGSRKGSKANCLEIAKLCMKYKVKVVVDSDAHFATAIGKFNEADELLKSIDMPEELILSLNERNVLEHFKSKKNLIDIIID